MENQSQKANGIEHIIERAQRDSIQEEIDDLERFGVLGSKADLISSVWWARQENRHRPDREATRSYEDSFRTVRRMGEDYSLRKGWMQAFWKELFAWAVLLVGAVIIFAVPLAIWILL